MDLPNLFRTNLIMQRFAGLAPFRLNKTNKTFHTSFWDNFIFLINIFQVTFATIISFFTAKLINSYSTYELSELSRIHQSTAISRTTLIQQTMSVLAYILLLIFSIVKKNAHIKLLENLFQIDFEIHQFFRINCDYEKFKKTYKICVNYLIVHCYVVNYVFFSYCCLTKTSLINSTTTFVFIANMLTTPINALHYYFLCRILTKQFKNIEILLNENNFNNSDLYKLIKLTKKLRKCLAVLNESQGLQIFVNILNSSFFFVILIFYIFYGIFLSKYDLTYHDIIGNGVWTISHLMKIICVSLAGEDLYLQIEATNRSISNHYYRRFNGDEREMVSGSSCDNMFGKQLKCNGASCFNIDRKFLLSLVAAMTSNLIVVLQFKNNEDDQIAESLNNTIY